jgi:competence protein ComEA
VAESPAARALREGEPIDLNRASARDLQLLPGIGPKLAARVTRNRRQAGPFENVEDMARVRGIGPKTIARLKSLVRTPVDASVAGDQTADAGAPGP